MTTVCVLVFEDYETQVKAEQEVEMWTPIYTVVTMVIHRTYFVFVSLFLHQWVDEPQ